MKRFFLLITLVFSVHIFGQVTFVVNDLPDNTLESTSIYISGDFEGWTGGQESYKLTKADNSFFITVPEKKHAISFKFTQGSWDTVERDFEGNQIDNRNYKFDKKNDTVAVKIESWDKSDDIQKSTRANNVFVLSEDFEIPQLNRKRRIWIYLPPNYKTANKPFPVIYMHDGQNVFDASTSNYGEWGVDETLNKFYKDYNTSFIVVGIDNGKDKRLDEYSPWENESYGGGEGDAYLEFIVKTLKPYIDINYKTKKDRNNTAIIGSSMGGLISHYAGLKYSEIFGKIGVYSPAFWFAPEVNKFSKIHGDIQDTKMYFLAGGKEGSDVAYNEISQTVTDMNNMISVLKNQGFPSENIQSKVEPEGKHNEKFWRTNFEETILWLFKDEIQERKFETVTFSKKELSLKVSDGSYQIKFLTSKIAETTFIPKDQKIAETTSHAVVIKSTYTDVDFKEDSQEVVFNTDDVSVIIKKEPFHISYWYKGKELISEKNGYQQNDDFETLQFNLNPTEVLYGAGARALGMNRRGNRLQLYNKAHYGYEENSKLMNFTMPLVYSSNLYAVHFDNAPIGYLDLDSEQNNTLTYETISGRKTYQVIAGNSWLDLIDNYTDLTGKQPMLPRWALGNFSSRFGYHSQKETENTIAKFKSEKIPVDAVILDLYWFGKDIRGTMGNLEVYKDSFPDMKKMISNFKKEGVKTVLITEPFVLSTSKKWKEAVAKNVLAKDSIGKSATYDFYFGNTGIIDIYSKQGKEWFWNIYKDIKDLGVEGFWGDLGEPEVHPKWVQHAAGSADEVHNIYGHDWARLIFEGYSEEYPNERPFILMRAGYSGSQRFGMVPWSGDVNRSWGGLQSQPEIALQMGMQGLGYMHSDLGGFAGANLDDELYERWLQYGVFQPIYRPHAQEEVPSEPVFRSDKTKQNAKTSIELRYKLLPYNYTLAFENNQKGKPLMRPLFFEESNNKTQLINASTYLWGNDFLITPIVNSGVKEKNVYFPKGNVWFDFYTDEKIDGGQTKTVLTQKNNIPTFVRAGAFIPMAKSMQSTKEYSGNDISLHYYYDTSVVESDYKLYNDDGLTNSAFEKGKYELLEFEAKLDKRNLKIDFEAEMGIHYTSVEKHINLIIHNIQQQPKSIKIDGKKVDVKWNSTAKILSIPIVWNTYTKAEIIIKLNK